jgi:hypothetical protein
MLLLAVAPVRAADEDAEITAAQQALETAASHLKAAPHDYKGHRTNALKNVNQALAQLKQATAVTEKRDAKEQKKEAKQEEKAAKKKK